MIKRLSLEDPNVLAEADGQLYRLIYRSATHSGRWGGLAGFLQSPAFSALVDAGLVPAHEQVDLPLVFDWERPGDRLAAFRVERVEPFSYLRDWTAAQARDVVLAAIRINIALLRSGSLFLCNECLDWNFTFKHTRPVMVDAGAFSKDAPCVRQIPAVLKVALTRAHISLPSFRFDRPLSIAFLDELAAVVQAVRVADKQTAWDRYGHTVAASSAKTVAPQTDEERGMLDVVAGLGVRSLLDVGCNAGAFAVLFAARGISVTAIDRAPNCVNSLYRLSESLGLPITALHIDCRIVDKKQWPLNGSPNCIDHVAPDGDWVERLRSEAVFVSSVTHHLCCDNFGFVKQAALWGKLAKRWLLVEFIAPEDVHVRTMKLGDGYTRECFLSSLEGEFCVRDTRSFMEHRTWYLFERSRL